MTSHPDASERAPPRALDLEAFAAQVRDAENCRQHLQQAIDDRERQAAALERQLERLQRPVVGWLQRGSRLAVETRLTRLIEEITARRRHLRRIVVDADFAIDARARSLFAELRRRYDALIATAADDDAHPRGESGPPVLDLIQSPTPPLPLGHARSAAVFIFPHFVAIAAAARPLAIVDIRHMFLSAGVVRPTGVGSTPVHELQVTLPTGFNQSYPFGDGGTCDAFVETFAAYIDALPALTQTEPPPVFSETPSATLDAESGLDTHPLPQSIAATSSPRDGKPVGTFGSSPPTATGVSSPRVAPLPAATVPAPTVMAAPSPLPELAWLALSAKGGDAGLDPAIGPQPSVDTIATHRQSSLRSDTPAPSPVMVASPRIEAVFAAVWSASADPPSTPTDDRPQAVIRDTHVSADGILSPIDIPAFPATHVSATAATVTSPLAPSTITSCPPSPVEAPVTWLDVPGSSSERDRFDFEFFGAAAAVSMDAAAMPSASADESVSFLGEPDWPSPPESIAVASFGTLSDAPAEAVAATPALANDVARHLDLSLPSSGSGAAESGSLDAAAGLAADAPSTTSSSVDTPDALAEPSPIPVPPAVARVESTEAVATRVPDVSTEAMGPFGDLEPIAEPLNGSPVPTPAATALSRVAATPLTDTGTVTPVSAGEPGLPPERVAVPEEPEHLQAATTEVPTTVAAVDSAGGALPSPASSLLDSEREAFAPASAGTESAAPANAVVVPPAATASRYAVVDDDAALHWAEPFSSRHLPAPPILQPVAKDAVRSAAHAVTQPARRAATMPAIRAGARYGSALLASLKGRPTQICGWLGRWIANAVRGAAPFLATRIRRLSHATHVRGPSFHVATLRASQALGPRLSGMSRHVIGLLGATPSALRRIVMRLSAPQAAALRLPLASPGLRTVAAVAASVALALGVVGAAPLLWRQPTASPVVASPPAAKPSVPEPMPSVTAPMPSMPAPPSTAVAPPPPPMPADSGRPLSASEVAQLQRQLRALGFKPGPADGVVGPRTIAAAREFQAAHGLPATGRIDSDLLAEVTSRQYQ